MNTPLTPLPCYAVLQTKPTWGEPNDRTQLCPAISRDFKRNESKNLPGMQQTKSMTTKWSSWTWCVSTAGLLDTDMIDNSNTFAVQNTGSVKLWSCTLASPVYILAVTVTPHKSTGGTQTKWCIYLEKKHFILYSMLSQFFFFKSTSVFCVLFPFLTVLTHCSNVYVCWDLILYHFKY